MKIACSCDSAKHFDSPAEWAQHYNLNKPSDTHGRMVYARNHTSIIVPLSNPVAPSVQRVNTLDPLQRIREISRRVEAMYGQILELEEERIKLMRTLEPIAPKAPIEWMRGDGGTCKECGRKTTWKLRGAYHCHGECSRRQPGEVVASELEAELRKIMEG